MLRKTSSYLFSRFLEKELFVLPFKWNADRKIVGVFQCLGVSNLLNIHNKLEAVMIRIISKQDCCGKNKQMQKEKPLIISDICKTVGVQRG